MTTAEERMKILKMIQEGKISADEGAKLLKALSASSDKPKRSDKPNPGGARWLRVRVTDMHKGKAKVNVNLPLKLIDAGLNIAAQFTPDVEFEELGQAVSEAIAEGMTGKIVDVVDAEDGEHIEVFIE
ncbi:MAG: hypothetical protein H8E28_15765 [Anaerolineae bacterium]|nr:hypothetical protein [Anaerolineae bacterium]MBL6966256.1 hypothetical protein [Anaerolineales bacterium]